MAIELLLWFGMAAVAAVFAHRLVRQLRRRSRGSDRLAESFERHKTLELGFDERRQPSDYEHWRGAA